MSSTKPIPTGPRRQTTEEWKARVRQRLGELGRDHRWLEAQIAGRGGRSAGRGSVTKLLSAGDNTSGLVDPICQILGVDPPMAEVNSSQEFALLAAFRQMSPDQRRHLIGLLGLDEKPRKG